VSSDRRLFSSDDAGVTWRPVEGPPGHLAWPAPDALYVLRDDGELLRSVDSGRTRSAAGRLDGQPAASAAISSAELYVALHDGTVLFSRSGGRAWAVRSKP
jgi:hypothetical protein